jgi:predicted Zn-dependent peptidase
MSIKTYKLTNGINVVEDHIAEAQSFTLLVMAKTGSRNETPEIWGISHFLEHMAFKGTPSFPSSEVLNKELDSLGAMYNAFTSKEFTGYYIKGSKLIFNRALKIVSEMTTSPIILDEEVDRERGTIIEEINMYEDDPRRKIVDNFEEALYDNLLIAQNSTGDKKSLGGIHAKQIHDYRSKYYVGGNLYISLSGAIPVYFQTELEKSFSHVQKGEKSFLPSVEKKAKRISLEYKATQQAHLAVGFPGLKMTDKNEEVAKLLSIILGGNFSSRMFSEVREKRGLAYYIRTYSDNMFDTGSIATFAGVGNENVEKALQVITDVYRSAKNDITAEELRRAKDYSIGMMTLQYEDSEYRSEVNSIMDMYGLSVLSLKERIRETERITLKEIQALAKELLDFDKVCFALIGPFKDEAKFAKIFE